MAGGFESRKFQGLTVSLTLNRLSDQTYVFVFPGVYQSDSEKESCPKLFFELAIVFFASCPLLVLVCVSLSFFSFCAKNTSLLLAFAPSPEPGFVK